MANAFVFPGQGVQAVGMMADFLEAEPLFRNRLQEASAIIEQDLLGLVENGPQAILDQTEITQPIILALSVARYEVWLERGGEKPALVAGHSLGEYSALTAVGGLGYADAVKLVHERGKLMQAAVPQGEGSMAAVIGCELQLIEDICESTVGIVSPANINSPGQVVIAGEAIAVDAASTKLLEAGARRVVPLAVSVPSHTELMNPTIKGVTQLLDEIEIKTPECALVQNVDAKPHDDTEEIRANLISQLCSPVRWADVFTCIIDHGCDPIYECGPGTVLTGLARRIKREANALSLGKLDTN